MSKKIKVFYDGQCNICNKEINFYAKIDKNKNFDWVNIHNNNVKITNTGLSKKIKISANLVSEELDLNEKIEGEIDIEI